MFTFSSVTPEKVDSLKDKLAGSGVTVKVMDDSHYQITGNGITAIVTYDEPQMVLSVTILHKPFIIAESFIQDKIRQALG